MKTFHIITTIVTMGVVGCARNDVNPLMKIEANIGESFIVSAPAEVVFKETGVKLYIDHISDYGSAGFNSPIVTAKIRFNGSPFDVRHSIYCESCIPEIVLNELYSLKFEKVLATTKIKDNDAGVDFYRVDSAQFILRTH